MGSTDHCCFENAWKFEQHIFDLLRINVLATANDHLFKASDDDQITILIDPPDVTGVQPAIDDGLRCFFGFTKVTAHDVRALHQHLASGAL
ncbi:hypothetical protein D3C75_984890 [compost metagenome]